MGKFKKGDKVRLVEGGEISAVAGATGTVGARGMFSRYVDVIWDRNGLDRGQGDGGYYPRHFELVVPEPEPEWVPKVGDRVLENKEFGGEDLVKHWNTYWRYKEGDLSEDSFVVTRLSGNSVHYSNKTGGNGPQVDVKYLKPTPTTLNIQAGRYYRTRDGRKVGPAEKADCVWTDARGLRCDFSIGSGFDRQDYTASGLWLTRYDKESEHDIIAEWVDEPAAKPAAAEAAKFKVGDRVNVVGNRPGLVSKIGQCGVVKTVHGVGVYTVLLEDQRGYDFVDAELSATPTTPAIVALIANGTPAPSATPKVHASQEAAAEEAGRLADLHKGQTFGVFVLAETKEVAKPVYEHEWQRLAAEGQFIPAVKELRAKASLDLLSAKQGVERFIEKIAA